MAENDSRPQATNKYSLYTSRNVKDQQIDWANVAQTLTTGLEATTRIRSITARRCQTISGWCWFFTGCDSSSTRTNSYRYARCYL